MVEKKVSNNLFWVNLLFIFISLIGVNVLSSYLFFRLDMTEDRLYTLSEGTEKIVKKINKPFQIKFYFSEDSENIPVFYKEYGNKVNNLLEEYAGLNSDFVTFEKFNPAPDSDEEVWANRYGLQSADLNFGEKFYLGAAFVSGKQESIISFFDLRREQFLEYDITKAIYDVALKQENKLGIATGLPIFGQPAFPGQSRQGPEKWALIEELEKFYEIIQVDADLGKIPEEVTTLVVIHPQNFSEQAFYAVDQFLLRGGQLILLLDPFMRLDPLAAQRAQAGQRAPSSSDFEKLLTHWGVDYAKDQVVGDETGSLVIGGGFRYPYYLGLSPAAQNTDLVAVQNLEEVILGEPGGFNLKEDSPLKSINILKTSNAAGQVNAIMPMFSPPETIAKNFQPGNKSYILAGLLGGKLTSAFDSPPAELNDEQKKAFLKESTQENRILIITDVDFLTDQLSVQRVNLLGNSFYQPKNDNLGFFINMVDFMEGAQDMMAIRSRGKFSRPLKVFVEMQKESQRKFDKAEEALEDKLKKIQDELSQLKPEEGTSSIKLSKEQADSITRFKKDELATKQELREIKRLLRKDIEELQNVLIGVNIAAIPLLITLLGIFIYLNRSKKKST